MNSYKRFVAFDEGGNFISQSSSYSHLINNLSFKKPQNFEIWDTNFYPNHSDTLGLVATGRIYKKKNALDKHAPIRLEHADSSVDYITFDPNNCSGISLSEYEKRLNSIVKNLHD